MTGCLWRGVNLCGAKIGNVLRRTFGQDHFVVVYSVALIFCRDVAMNKEQLREYRKAWFKSNRAKANEYQRLWRLKNLEKARESDNRRRKKYAARIRTYNLAYTRKNKEWARAQCKKWRTSNPEASQEGNVKRRLRENGARPHGRLSHGLTNKLLAAQGWKCAICFCNLRVHKYHRDHIIPLARGGLHCDANMQMLCQPCNLSKGAKMPL